MQNILKREFPQVMGIINMSPDSFYSGSRCLSEAQFEETFGEMVANGADIIDIGACSTRPGSSYITQEEEWDLLKPALKVVLKRFPSSIISIDTFRSYIVERAFDFVGDFIVNDISAGEEDSNMLSKVAQFKLPYIAMHKRGTPQTMQSMCNYQNVTLEVKEYLANFVKKGEEMGIEELIIDPGFGFAKNIEQNYQMLSQLSLFDIEDSRGKKVPLLVGLSRKGMIHKYLQITPQESLSATCALELTALLNGADIIRAHDVKEASQMVKLFKILSQ